MSAIDIYDEEKIARLLHVQKVQGIDFMESIDWTTSIDLEKPLLPIDGNALLFPEANEEERLVISQVMGLIVASTISELEDVAISLKGPTWENVLNKYPVNPEIREMGELFYEDERKHSIAFKKYINLFAGKVNVDPEDLRKFLPSSQKLAKTIYQMNSFCGGMAIWWLIAAVEEESILIFDQMKKDRAQIDPLYYAVHKAHYEEEIRHKSYASIMLQINHDFAHSPVSQGLKKIDFLLAEVLNITWTFSQLYKVKELRSLENHHPFFRTISRLQKVLKKRSSFETFDVLFNKAPYTRDMLNLSEHKNIQSMMNRFGALKTPVQRMKGA